MSITITINTATPAEAIAVMREFAFAQDKVSTAVAGPTALNIAPGVSDAPSVTAAETPKVEPEIVPPKRTRTTKKAETVVQSDVTDIDTNGDPVVADEFAGKSIDEIAEALRPLMVEAVKAKGQDPIFAILAEFKVKNRTEAAKLPNVGELAARLRKEVA